MGSERTKVVIVGAGYVGFPTAVLLAQAGIEVLAVDTNAEIVAAINAGKAHIDEHELRELMSDANVRKNLRASATPESGDVFILAVPTPLEHPRKTAELALVRAATEAVLPHLKKGNLLVLESTVPPGTCKNVIAPILARGGFAPADILVAHCPERVLPGDVVREIVHNDRIIGGTTPAATDAACALYTRFVKGELIRTDDVTAELCKLMENTYRDVNIALANELAKVCASLEIDVHRAIDIANRHPRVNLLRPGIGVGGHCIPIDPWFITEVDPESCVLIPAARRTNDAQPGRIASLIRRAVADVSDPKILCVGATYKQDIYDLREAPAREVHHLLQLDGYDARIVDPITREFPCDDLARAAEGCDLVVILVPHKKVMDEVAARKGAILKAMRRPHIVDASGGRLAPL